MIEFITQNSGLISLVGFFTFFGVVFIWAMLPKNKQKFEEYKNIPLREKD